MQRHHDKRLICGLFALLALDLACSSGEVNLGDGTISQNFTQLSRCADSPRLEGVIYVHDQAELEQLSGCEQIGELRIVPFEGIDLTALASLRTVDAAFEIGADPEVYPEDVEEQTAFLEPIRALQEGGWIDALHGLENLESVPSFYLRGVGVTDLSELESLAEIEQGFVIRHATHLENLSGLLARPPLLWIADAGALTSLDGLTLDAAAGSIILEGVPALANLDALQNLTSADTLILSNTGLASFPDLPGLVYVASLYIDNNAVLTDLSPLDQLQSVDSLYIGANPSLTLLPDFSQLSSFEDLTVLGNAALQELALNFPALTTQTRSVGERQVELSIAYVEISYNDSLQRITSPASFSSVQFFSVFQNPLLTEIDLGQLQHADILLIDDNATLSSVVAPALATVNTLIVENNPQFSPAVFDGVQTFSREISGNAHAAAP